MDVPAGTGAVLCDIAFKGPSTSSRITLSSRPTESSFPRVPSRDYDAINFLSHAAAGPRKERVRKRAYSRPRPKSRPYAELRAASAFSFLDSASLPEDLIYHAAQHDLPAMALVDRNGVYGAPRFYSAAKKA